MKQKKENGTAGSYSLVSAALKLAGMPDGDG
jgi:hypothetical protein